MNRALHSFSVLATLLLTPFAAAQVVDSVTPSIGAYGTPITIDGSGFGAKPKVDLVSQADGKAHKLKLLEVSDTQIVGELRKLPAGDYEVRVTPKGGSPAVASAPLVVALPTDVLLAEESAEAGDEVTLTAEHLGTKKGTITVGGKKAKVLSWGEPTAGGAASAAETSRQVVFRLNKKTPAGEQVVLVKNTAGEVTVAQSLEVTEPDGGGGNGIPGNPYSSTKPGLQLRIDGGDPILIGSPYKDFSNQGTTTHKVWQQNQGFKRVEIYIDYFNNAPSSPNKTKTLQQPKVHIIYKTLGGIWTTTNDPAVGDVLAGSDATVTVTGSVSSFLGNSFGGSFSGTLIKVSGTGPDTITITEGFFWTTFSVG